MTELDWNKEFALEQAADDADLLNELLEIFKDSSANDLHLIKEGIDQENVEQIAAAAHSIKGAAASLGINGITAVAKKIEEDCRQGGIEVARDQLAHLEGLLQQLSKL